MKILDIHLERDSACRITGWIHSPNGSRELPQRLYPAIVICPGGGYQLVSDREAEPVAAPFYAAGYNTFILRYSIGADASGLRPLCQLAALVEELRSRHEEYCTVVAHILFHLTCHALTYPMRENADRGLTTEKSA